jgi:hypothetical protein
MLTRLGLSVLSLSLIQSAAFAGTYTGDLQCLKALRKAGESRISDNENMIVIPKSRNNKPGFYVVTDGSIKWFKIEPVEGPPKTVEYFFTDENGSQRKYHGTLQVWAPRESNSESQVHLDYDFASLKGSAGVKGTPSLERILEIPDAEALDALQSAIDSAMREANTTPLNIKAERLDSIRNELALRKTRGETTAGVPTVTRRRHGGLKTPHVREMSLADLESELKSLETSIARNRAGEVALSNSAKNKVKQALDKCFEVGGVRTKSEVTRIRTPDVRNRRLEPQGSGGVQ